VRTRGEEWRSGTPPGRKKDWNSMTTDDKTLWKTLQKYTPRKRWVALADIFAIVQRRTDLDTGDLERTNSRSGTPRWKSNIRRILHSKQRDGSIRGRKTQEE
jgi:hypothetical protein